MSLSFVIELIKSIYNAYGLLPAFIILFFSSVIINVRQLLEIHSLKVNLISLEGSKETLHERIAFLQDKNNDIEKKLEKVSPDVLLKSYKTRLEAAYSEIERLNKDKEANRIEIEQKKHELEQLLIEINQLKERLENYQFELNRLTQELEKGLQEIKPISFSYSYTRTPSEIIIHDDPQIRVIANLTSLGFRTTLTNKATGTTSAGPDYFGNPNDYTFRPATGTLIRKSF